MFREWDNFYLIVGSAAGALIGIMFVVATLTAGFETSVRSNRGAQVYITPIVFHFAMIVIVSAISAVPELSLSATGVALGLCAAVGLAYSVTTTLRIFARGFTRDPDASDKCFYGFFPAFVYLVLGGAAAAVLFAARSAAYATGAAMLVLLLIGIRNAWDLAIFLAQGSSDRRA